MAHGDQVELAAPIEVIPGGEFAKKQDAAVERLVKLAYQTHFGRKDTFIAVGGGAVQDTVGYAAAIIHRGCRMIRVNSTTLAQADAGVGVKNGIDYASGKNFLGTFAVPYAVLNDVALLTTLSDKDWRNGIAEAVKVAVIKDAAFLQWIQEHADALRMRDLEAMEYLVQRTAELHLMHIAYNGDPFERGSARPLDFGHWSAHRLESITCWQISHGEAVAVGIALDMLYASLLGMVSGTEATRVIATLQECGLKVWCDELNLPYSTTLFRLNHGFDVEKAFTKSTDNQNYYEYKGKILNINQIVEITGLTKTNVWNRLHRGWSIERLMTQPARKVRRKNE
jgi:3-dehydroquinate synthase